MPEMDSEDEEYLSTVNLDDPVWSGEPVLDSCEHLFIHVIPRPANPQPIQGVPVTPPPQPDQVEMPPDLIEFNISEDIPDY